MIFFSSDTHFHHVNIMDYCPWRRTWAKDVDHMNSVLIAAWNSVVQPTDVVYHLGDFSFGTDDQIRDIKIALNGEIKLAIGNHDKTRTRMRTLGFTDVEHFYQIAYNGITFGMTHDPVRFRPEQLASSNLLLHGHRHGMEHHVGEEGYDKFSSDSKAKLFDVGVDAVRRTRPCTIDEIRDLFFERQNARLCDSPNS